jgi:methylphosphotriester-DNA--protein-cysteine methyltransferase
MPHQSLRSLVRGTYSAWTEHTSRPVRRLETASAIVPMIINFGPAYRLFSGTDVEVSGAVQQSFVAGLYDSWVAVEGATTACAMQVNFTPLGARILTGIPMHLLTGQSLSLECVFGASARALEEQLGNCATWHERFARLDSYLCARLTQQLSQRTGAIAVEVQWAWNHLATHHGDVRIAELSRHIGWSAKRLITAFRDSCGLPPKAVARLLRFEHLVACIDAAPHASWTARAVDGGFFDQAHLVHEFAQFAGCTPTEYLRARLPEGGGVLSPMP